MQRVTLRVPGQQLKMLGALVKLGDFPTVSEAVRAGVRDLIERRRGKLNRMADSCHDHEDFPSVSGTVKS